MRSREVNMEKENINKARDKSKIAKELMNKMIPQMGWFPPLGIIEFNKHKIRITT